MFNCDQNITLLFYFRSNTCRSRFNFIKIDVVPIVNCFVIIVFVLLNLFCYIELLIVIMLLS